jgi:hypothetical protein
MKKDKNIETKIKTTKPNLKTDPTTDKQILNDCFSAMKQSRHTRKQKLGRIIMKSNIIKFAATITVITAAIFSVSILDFSVSSAFAIEQVIEAYSSVRYLHVKQFKVNQQEPLEYWIKSDDHGNITNARYYLPEHVSPEDGAKLITWTPQVAELWFKRKNSYLLYQSRRIEGWMRSLLVQSQPQLVMEKLQKAQHQGDIQMDINEPEDKQEPISIIVTYNSKPKKEIYYIDQATNLIKYIEFFNRKDNKDILESTTEFYDYNVAIDAKMFSIRDEVPQDATVVDWVNQLIGIPQGDMTYEQAAAETVRQFFQALIDKDYEKVGLIFSGVSAEKAKEYFGRFNFTSIISIGTPTPYPKCGKHSFSITCEIEYITPEGKTKVKKFESVKARCGDDEIHPDRWIIHGGI